MGKRSVSGTISLILVSACVGFFIGQQSPSVFRAADPVVSPAVRSLAAVASTKAPSSRSIVTEAPKQAKVTATPKPAKTQYVLNTSTKKFHKPTCASVKQMKSSNTKYSTDSREEIIAAGYDPCGRCHP